MSKEAKHTPGEWEILKGPCDDNDEYEVYVGVQYPNHCPKHVARVYGHGADYHNDPEMQANARLIASAPEMAEALRDLAQWVAVADTNGAYKNCAAPVAASKALDRADELLRKAGLL